MKIPLISYEGTGPDPDAQAHRVDQVLMNINVNLMKERGGKKRGRKASQEQPVEKDELEKVT